MLITLTSPLFVSTNSYEIILHTPFISDPGQKNRSKAFADRLSTRFIIEFVDYKVICDLQQDILCLGQRYSKAVNIWRSMCCIRQYNIETIVIGQNPYESQIVPFLGSAFSQVENSKDTPTTSIFASHFKDDKSAKKFLRYSWKYLPVGIAFVNADYYPSSLGGGSSSIYSYLIHRSYKTILSHHHF